MSAIRVTKLFVDGIKLEATKDSALYQFLRPGFISRKDDKRQIRAQRWARFVEAIEHLAGKRSDIPLEWEKQELLIEERDMLLDWQYEAGWKKAIQWPIFMEARKWSPDMVFETKEQNAVQLLTKLINTKGGEEIFANYVEAIANAMATSKYTEVDEDLQSKLRVNFWDDIARPTFDRLRANKAAQDQIKQEIAEKEATQANQAASSYLAARG